jgi:cation efflux system membrane fusion protein
MNKFNQSALAGSLVALGLFWGSPQPLWAHVGHGDEFQAQGGVNKVAVNPETDSLLGIVVAPIEQAAPNGQGVMVPVTALVDAHGKQLVFVQYGNFYEPVEVTTASAEGDQVQVVDKLSVGEKLVTQGSLSLYAESRKTQKAEAESPPEPIVAPASSEAHAQADAQGIPHQHDTTGNMTTSAATSPSGGNPIIGILGGIGGLLVGGTGFLFLLRTVNLRKKNNRGARKSAPPEPQASYRE